MTEPKPGVASKIRIHSVKYQVGTSGVTLRCTVDLILNAEESWATSGCLIWRDQRTGQLKLSTPVVKWKVGARTINLRPVTGSPALVAKILDGVERAYGKELQATGVSRSNGVPIEEVDSTLPSEVEV